MAAESMLFPETVDEFMEQYKIVDIEQVYTNGTELVPIFRMQQWFERLHAADVRPVVLCKDCREYDTTGYDDTPGFGWCECLHRDVQGCFYCAHGEKGENR